MNITNVVLDRDKKIVTYDTADKEGVVHPIVWTEDAGGVLTGWCALGCYVHEEEVNSYLKGVELDGLSLENLSMRKESKPDQEPTPDYYNYEYKGLKLDPYRVCKIYNVANPCQQHAIKKLLRGLNKGDVETPLELIESVEGILARWKEMIKEDAE